MNFILQHSIWLNITFRNAYKFVLFHLFFSLLERIFRKEWRKMSIIKMLCEQWMSSNAPNETMIWMKAHNLFCSSELEWFQLCAEKKFEACKRYCNCYCSQSNSFHWVKLAWQIPNEWFNVLVAVIQWASIYMIKFSFSLSQREMANCVKWMYSIRVITNVHSRQSIHLKKSAEHSWYR